MFATEITTIANNIKQIMPIIDSELILQHECFNINNIKLYSAEYNKKSDDTNIIIVLCIELKNWNNTICISARCYAAEIQYNNEYLPFYFEHYISKPIQYNIINNEITDNIKRIYNRVLNNYIEEYKNHMLVNYVNTAH